MRVYYNEVDPQKAAWLRELMRAGAIASGEVDERSISDVRPDDLRGFTRCHFFAGIGVWDYSLRLAGWPDDRPVWTGSCPCPSFSVAGKGAGFDDPRHLWPVWFALIRERRPRTILGEQVAAAIGHGWLDLVCGDVEAEGYAIAAAVLGAHSAGAPHIRQRLYFGAHAEHTQRRPESTKHGNAHWRQGLGWDSAAGKRPDADGRVSGNGDLQRRGEQRLQPQDCGVGDSSDASQRRLAVCGSAPGIAGYAAQPGETGERSYASRHNKRWLPKSAVHWERIAAGGSSGPVASPAVVGDDALSPRLEGHFGDAREWRGPGWLDPLTARSVAETGATRGFWGDCDWWYGRDEKYRPAGPGIFPLAAGSPARVVRLRGYGDAINAEIAALFIASALEVMP